MKRILLFLCIIVVLGSCSSEKSNIKRALKSSVPQELIKEYKFKEYTVLETILEMNLKDSIAAQESKIKVNELMMKSDSTRLLGYQAEIQSCKYQQATTLSWLRSSYNSIIRTYEDMANDVIEKLEEKSAENDECRRIIRKHEDAISSTDSPIIYYKVRHNYTIHGAIRDTVVTLDSKYQLVTE